jgi:hypothetical protein
MIRDQETLNLLKDSIARFVREVLIPHEDLVAESDAIPDAWSRRCASSACSACASPRSTAAWR